MSAKLIWTDPAKVWEFQDCQEDFSNEGEVPHLVTVITTSAAVLYQCEITGKSEEILKESVLCNYPY